MATACGSRPIAVACNAGTNDNRAQILIAVSVEVACWPREHSQQRGCDARVSEGVGCRWSVNSRRPSPRLQLRHCAHEMRCVCARTCQLVVRISRVHTRAVGYKPEEHTTGAYTGNAPRCTQGHAPLTRRMTFRNLQEDSDNKISLHVDAPPVAAAPVLSSSTAILRSPHPPHAWPRPIRTDDLHSHSHTKQPVTPPDKQDTRTRDKPRAMLQ
jgi:hypothetical protein